MDSMIGEVFHFSFSLSNKFNSATFSEILCVVSVGVLTDK